MFTYIYAYLHTYTYTCIVYIHTFAYMHTNTGSTYEVHTYIHTYELHTYIHTYVKLPFRRSLTSSPAPALFFLTRKLEDKGIGELSFDEVYRALLLGAVPPALVTDAVRLLAAGRPGEGGGAAFLSGEAATQAAYYGREGGGDVSFVVVVSVFLV